MRVVRSVGRVCALGNSVPRPVLVLVFLSSCIGAIDDPRLPPAPEVPDADPGAGLLDDAGQRDAVPSDAGHSDAGHPDAGHSPDAGHPDAGPPVDLCAAVHCDAGAYCVAGACLAGDPGDPALHSQQQVCDAWAAGHVVADHHPFSKSMTTCDPGVLTAAGIGDALTRLAMHRYLAGLGPVADSAAEDSAAQQCALISAWNPVGSNAHFPPPGSTCYTQAGAGAAGESNIAWGAGDPGNSIDIWMEDDGNEDSFGHRRWLLNPPLGPVGFGFYEGGNNYGTASCIEVFNSSGHGPSRPYVAWPPPGFVPLDVANMTWTVQGSIPEQNVTVDIVDDASGAHLDAGVTVLGGNYGNSDALRIDRTGWAPQAGATYHVTLTGSGHAPITYDVKPVACAAN